MAEFFFAAAWAAGIVEGGSILSYANKLDGTKQSTSPALILVPSLLYGTVALPLGCIGASPGPSLIDSFPFAPSINVLNSSGMTGMARPPLKNDHADKHTNDSVSQKRESETLEEEQEVHEQPIISRSEMIRRVREENRRSLAAKQQQHRPLPARTTTNTTLPHTRNAAATKFLSTLDGRPLATPLAEAMRRTRFLCVGAGLVMSMISFEHSRQERLKQEQAAQLEQRQRGRDVDTILSLVNEGDSDNGVAVRLVGQHESLNDLTTMSKGVVVPLLYSVESPENATCESTYWNLGTTPKEWKQMPLTKDWLLYPGENNDGHAYLVLESDLTSGTLDDYLSPLYARRRIQSLQPLENAMWVSRILDIVAQHKGLTTSDDDEQANEATTVNVLIGSGIRLPMLLDSNSIYINGPVTVGSEVMTTLERVYSKDTQPEGSEAPVHKDSAMTDESTTVAEEPPPTQSATTLRVPKPVDDAFSALEYVGMKLRQGGTYAATAVTQVFSAGNNNRKVVHVLSDSPVVVQWLRQTMPYAWIVLGYNALTEIETYHTYTGGRKHGVTFVCCVNDEATCSVVCSLLTEDQAASKHINIVALVREESCASMLRSLAEDLKKEDNIEVVSVQSVHNSLFDHARELLASGKTPSEVQESIDLNQ